MAEKLTMSNFAFLLSFVISDLSPLKAFKISTSSFLQAFSLAKYVTFEGRSMTGIAT